MVVAPLSERTKFGFVCGWPEDVEGTRPLIHEDGEGVRVALEMGVASDGGALSEEGST